MWGEFLPVSVNKAEARRGWKGMEELGIVFESFCFFFAVIICEKREKTPVPTAYEVNTKLLSIKNKIKPTRLHVISSFTSFTPHPPKEK